jgi:hypothetical protein
MKAFFLRARRMFLPWEKSLLLIVEYLLKQYFGFKPFVTLIYETNAE